MISVGNVSFDSSLALRVGRAKGFQEIKLSALIHIKSNAISENGQARERLPKEIACRAENLKGGRKRETEREISKESTINCLYNVLMAPRPRLPARSHCFQCAEEQTAYLCNPILSNQSAL